MRKFNDMDNLMRRLPLLLLFFTSVIITPAQDPTPICVVGRTLCAGNVGNVTPPPFNGYNTVESGGNPVTQRNILNFIAGANMTISCADNAGTLTTNCTFVATGGGGGGGTPGGAPGQIQWNSAGNFGGISDFTFNGAHTLSLASLGVLDLHNAATGSLLLSSAFPNGLLRVNTGTGVMTSSELSGDVTTFGSNLVAVTHVLGVAYPGSNPINSVNVATLANQMNAKVIPTCGDTTHALSFDGTTHSFGCQGISGGGGGGTPGGLNTQLQFNSNGAFGGMTEFTYTGSTLAISSAGTLDVSASNNTLLGETLSSSLTPTIGSSSELSSWLLNAGTNDILSGPGFTNSNALRMQFYAASGQQDYTNASKRTINGIILYESAIAAGQRSGIAAQLYANGVGDAQGFNAYVQGGSINSAGDEGSVGIRSEVVGDQGAPQKTVGSLPAPGQTSCGTTSLVLAGSVSPSVNVQTVNVTGSTSGCVIGDHVVIARQAPVYGTSTEEMVVLTGVTSSSLSAKFMQAHLGGVTVTPTTKLPLGSVEDLGQLRWLRRVGHDYSSNSIGSISGTSVTGSGTSWVSTTFGGDAIEPGLFSMNADTNASQAVGLRSWFFISAVNSTTSLTLFGSYSGLGLGGGAYKAACGGVILGVELPTGTPNNYGQYAYLDTPPGTCFQAGDTVEMTAPVYGTWTGNQVILRNYVLATQLHQVGFAVTNIGDTEAGSGFSVAAPPSLFPDADHPAYRTGLDVGAFVGTGINFGYGVTGSLMGVNTYTGHGAPITWGAQTGLGSALLGPDTATGNFFIQSHSAKVQLGSTTDGNDQGILDLSGLTLTRTFTFPDHSGTFLLASDIGLTSVTRAVPASVGDAIQIGTIANGQNVSRDFEIFVTTDDHNVAKRYSFTQDQPSSTAGVWAKAIPLSESVVSATVDFDLEFLQDNPISLRLRKTVGSGTPTATVAIYCYSPDTLTYCTLTPSSATSTPSAPTSVLSSGLSQKNNIVNMYNTSGFFGGFDPSTLSASRTYTLPDASGTLALSTMGYNTVDSNGSAVTQRQILNFISGTNATVACVDNGGSSRTDCTISASSGAGSQLDQITAAAGANSINNADNAQVWNWSISTNSKIGFTIGENAASTGTGSILYDIQTLNTSTAIPFRVTAQGAANGVELTTAGVLHPIGTGHINADQINGTAFAGTNGDLVCFGAANIPADCGFLATNVVRKDAANTGATAMTLDMTASTTANAFRVPVGAGLTSGADGVIAYDSTSKLTHVRTNGADSSIISATATSTTTTQVLHATAVAGIGVFSAIVPSDLPGSGAVTINGQTCTLNSTCNVNVSAAAHSVSLNQGNGSPITGATIGTAGRLLIDQGAAADPTFNAVSGDTSITNAGVMTVAKVNGVSYGSSPSTNTTVIITASNTATYTAIPNCGDASHALAYDTTSHAFSCQAISTGSATAGGPANSIQWNNATALDGITQWSTNGTTTMTGSASAILDLHLAGTGGFLFPGAHASGIVKMTTATGAMTTVAAPTGAIVGTTDTQTLTNKSISGSQINSGLVGSPFGGTGANLSATAGIVRAGSPFTAAELSGDCTTSGSNAVTCTQINGLTIPLSALFVGTNASRQFTALTATTATAALNLFSSTLQGLVPLSGGGTTNFLRADGTWAVPSGGGGGSAFNAITNGTNTTATMVVGSGATLAPSGNGVITASTMLGVVNAVAPTAAGGCGMVFDNSTDNTTALQNCINGTPATGRTIWMPTGIALITDTITWSKDNVSFMGSNGFTESGLCYPGSAPGVCLGGTIIRASGGSWAGKYMFVIDGTSTTRGFVNAPSMRNIDIDANSLAAGVISMKYVNGGVFENNSWHDWTSTTGGGAHSVYGVYVFSGLTQAIGTCGNGGGKMIFSNMNISSYVGSGTGTNGVKLGDPASTSNTPGQGSDVCSIKMSNIFINYDDLPGNHGLWIANSDSDQFSNLSVAGFRGVSGVGNTLVVSGGVGTLTVPSHNMPSSGFGSSDDGIFLVNVCTTNTFPCTGSHVTGAEGTRAAAYASSTTITVTGLEGVANGTYFVTGIHGADIQLGGVTASGGINTTTMISQVLTDYGIYNPISGNTFNQVTGWNWGEAIGQNPTYSKPGGQTFPVTGTDGSLWNQTVRNLITFEPIGTFQNHLLTFSSARSIGGTVPDFYQVVDLTGLTSAGGGYYGVMLANNSSLGFARNGGGQLSGMGVDTSNNLNIGTGGTFGTLRIGQTGLTTVIPSTVQMPNLTASLCLALDGSKNIITQACAGGGSSNWSALVASTLSSAGTFATNSAAVFTWAGASGNVGKLQLTTDFNASSGEAAGMFINLAMPSTRGTNNYYGIRIDVADTLAFSSPFKVTNTGNGDSYYAGNQGLGSGGMSSTSYATDLNYSTTGFVSTGGVLPCVANSGGGVGSGCELTSNANLFTRGAIIYDWSFSASKELALEVANVSGGVNAVARFANFGDNRVNIRMYAGHTSQQEEGFCFDRYDTLTSPCLWFLGSTASGTVTATPFHLEDRLNSRTLLSATTGSASILKADKGLVIGNYTVGTLPTCGAGTDNAVVGVTDQNNAALGFGAAPSSGGTAHVIMHCNGVAWTVAGI